MTTHRQSGFTLVEIAIVLIIIGLMVGGLLAPLGMQLEQRKISETQKTMEDAREALLGYALRNGYLPCPAISASNGLEARVGTRCAGERRSGFLPWATLGLAKLDSWNHLFRYSVTPAFSDSGTVFSLGTPRDITVATRDGSGQLVAATAVNDIPAVILSHGKNGFGGSNELGGLIANGATSNTDEQLNAGSDTQFVSRYISDSATAPGGAYDDIVVWLSPNILFNRMVAVQKIQ